MYCDISTNVFINFVWYKHLNASTTLEPCSGKRGLNASLGCTLPSKTSPLKIHLVNDVEHSFDIQEIQK